MMDKTMITITVVICIAILEAIALFNGINGTFFTMVIGAMCALAGVMLDKKKIPILKDL